ncbi:MAG: hypothetical protein QNJ64_12450 [Crocosphaera sp.]|nr:hypothetical protein [Crocosphaera sp.]
MSEVKGVNPLPDKKADENVSSVDVKEYHTFIVTSTKHLFSAPTEKYKDIAKLLGLEDVDNDPKKAKGGLKLSQGSGYVYLAVRTKGGATLKVICDPDKIKGALDGLAGKKIYDAEIKKAYIPKKRVLI